MVFFATQAAKARFACNALVRSFITKNKPEYKAISHKATDGTHLQIQHKCSGGKADGDAVIEAKDGDLSLNDSCHAK